MDELATGLLPRGGRTWSGGSESEAERLKLQVFFLLDETSSVNLI